jgi:ribbon-helix-helix CopG family protein
VAVNLRLGAETEAALRAEAQRTGRSQQDILREAIGKYLGLIPNQADGIDPLITHGKVAAPRVPFRDVRPRLHLRPGETSLDLLDRDDRI